MKLLIVMGEKWDPPEGAEPTLNRGSETEKPPQIRQDVSHFDNSVSETHLTLGVLVKGTRDSSS